MGIAKADAVWQRVNHYCAIGSGGILLCLMLLVVADVSLRFLFLKPITGAIESTRLMLPWIAFLAFSYTLKAGGHVRVTLVFRRLPSQFQLWAEMFAYVVGLALCGVLTYFSWLHFYEAFVIKEYMEAAIKLPWWLGKMGMPIGMFVISVQCLLVLIAKFTCRKGKREV